MLFKSGLVQCEVQYFCQAWGLYILPLPPSPEISFLAVKGVGRGLLCLQLIDPGLHHKFPLVTVEQTLQRAKYASH